MLGVSTAVLSGSFDLDQLLWYEPDLVEIYNVTSEQASQLRRFAGRHGLRVALHTPTPFDGPFPLRRYCPTGPVEEEAVVARRLLARTVEYAAEVGAIHVVVHYPTPYPPFAREHLDRFGVRFLDDVDALIERYGVPVLVENLSTNPLLRTPDDYANALAGHPAIGFCLDLGHAHLMPQRMNPVAYGDALKTRVKSLHVYNASSDRYPVNGHEMADRIQQPRNGFMDLEPIIRHLLSVCRPWALVLEHSRAGTPQDALNCASWVRGIVAQVAGERREREAIGGG